MRIEIAKGLDDDAIRIMRADGSRAQTRFPKKGPFPHDAVHFVIERAFGFENAFWGHVARGAHPEEIAALAKAGGHASAKRAHLPDPAIAELIQAERIVECFEAEIWSGPAELDVLQSVADAAMAQSQAPVFTLGAEAVADARKELAALREAWRTLKSGEAISLDWPETNKGTRR